jgi:SAM-dependent methyltransferase
MPEPCWVCKGPTRPLARLAPLPVLACDSCGFVFRPDLASSVREVYEDGAYEQARGGLYASAAETAGRDRDAALRLAMVARHGGLGGDLLDVGAAGGHFVAAARDAGFRARGVEPTPSFAHFARDVAQVDVVQGTLEQLDLPERSLDVVTMWHVLEHIADPVAELRRIRDALRPGGLLCVEVPNFGGVAARLEGPAWASLEPDVHVNQFAPSSLREALVRAGLEVALVESISISPYLPARRRLAPGHLAARAKAAVLAGAPRARHPHAHELLRAVAHRPG